MADHLRALSETDVNDPVPPSALLPALTTPPFVFLPGTFNTRDIGLVPGAAHMRPGLAFRSGALNGLTADGKAGVAKLGVRRVFDLRSQTEHGEGPDPEIEGVENVWAETKEVDALVNIEDFVAGRGEEGYRFMYLDVLKVYRPGVRAVLEHVRDRAGEGFLFHCHAGRDRTGIVAGMLLTLAGEEPDVVELDFMLSRIGTEPAREELMAFVMHGSGAKDKNAPGFHNLVSLRRSCWKAFLEGVDQEYGGFEQYITKTLGFSEDDLATIKKNLRSESR